MGLHDFSFYDLINRNAIAFGSNICWHEVDDGRRVTFDDYKIRVDSLANGLSRIGIKKGDRIGVMGKNSLEYFLVYGAAAVLGAIILPINWRLSADEVCYNLNDCQPKVAFVDLEFQSILEEKRDELSSIESYYNLRSDSGEALPFSSLMDGTENVVPADVKSTDGFVIIHTAAVAGRPRGALLSHGNMVSANTEFNYCMKLTAGDVHLNLLPLFHVGGLFLASSTFQAGAVNLNVSKFEAKGAAKLIQEHGASVLFDFPPILDSILTAAKEAQYNLASLKAVVGLGTKDVIEEYQALTGGRYYALYGQTETSCVATLGKYSDRPGSAGKAVMLADIRLVDDHDRSVGIG
ncbi:MAG: AMP-binding protein, partial [Deltaproteobacteria bacterium]|nr:AMP-binding protein [Deltaproteobacteria bacterium]